MPRIVINPTTFRNSKDALCVAFDEGFRVLVEENGFVPKADPTPAQRKFFSDTPYAKDETQLRRTILARVCSFDTSVKDPTDAQLQEAAEFLKAVLDTGAPRDDWERKSVSRLLDAVRAALGASESRGGGGTEQPQERPEPQEQPQEQPQEPEPQDAVPETGTAGAVKGGEAKAADPLDYTDRYNTVLPPDRGAGYAAWRASLPEPLRNTRDYDLQGFYLKYGAQAKSAGQHLTDEFKKPNHPSFSTESVYSGTNGVVGGSWGGDERTGWTFTPSAHNRSLRTDRQILDYFRAGDPGVRVVLPAVAPEPSK